MASKFSINKPEVKDKEGLDRMKDKDRPFSRINYYMMGGCIALIVIGFLLMSGGGSTVENGFNPEIFSTRRIVVGPMFAFFGFLLMAFAIVYTPSSRRKEIASVLEAAKSAAAEANDAKPEAEIDVEVEVK